MILEKNGERIELTNEIQIAAYRSSGWSEAQPEEEEEQPTAEAQAVDDETEESKKTGRGRRK